MNQVLKSQRGAASVTTIIVLALLGAGVYLGLQYIPQLIESSTVDAMLGDIKKAHALKPAGEVRDLNEMIARTVNINQMGDMRKNFRVTESTDEFIVDVDYARELNLLVTKRMITYKKYLVLRKRGGDE